MELIVLVFITEFSVFLDLKIVTMSLNKIIFVGKRSDIKYFISLSLLSSVTCYKPLYSPQMKRM